MIEIRNDNSIILSQGDDFDVVFETEGEILLPADPAQTRLEIKYDIKRDPIIMALSNNIEATETGFLIYFVIDEVKKLFPGAYWYDIKTTTEEGKTRTLCWPKRLIIAEVAHEI